MTTNINIYTYHFRLLKRVSEIAVRRLKFFFGTVNTPILFRCATPSKTHSMSIWWPNWWKAESSSTRSSSKSFFPKKKPDVSWRWSPPSSNPYTLTGWVFLFLSQYYTAAESKTKTNFHGCFNLTSFVFSNLRFCFRALHAFWCRTRRVLRITHSNFFLWNRCSNYCLDGRSCNDSDSLLSVCLGSGPMLLVWACILLSSLGLG